jgi:WD40 repeat protein/serine/threonine protein kinase
MDDASSPPGRYCSHCRAAFHSELLLCPRDGYPIIEVHADPLLGQVLAGRYRVAALLGVGGMGRVYRVEHVLVGKLFALKVLYGDFAGEGQVVERFLREAQVLSQLSHRHIVSIVDFGESDTGLVYLVTELVLGQSLFDRGPVLFLRESVQVVRQIARALVHAHQHGVVHRDLKPENIMLVEEDDDPLVVKVLDFGIARVAPHPSGARERLTSAGVMMGTPAYMSPEQARGQDVDGRADLYALGVILYELLAGRLPFEADNPIDYVTQHITKQPPPIPPSRAPRALVEVTMRLLEKDPDRRFADAAQLLTALDTAYAAGTQHPTGSPPVQGERPTAAPAEARGVAQTEAAPVPAPPRHHSTEMAAVPSPASASTSGPAPVAHAPAEARREVPKATPDRAADVPPFREGEVLLNRWEVFGGTRGEHGHVVYVRDRVWEGLPLAMKTVGAARVPEQDRALEEAFRKAAGAWRDLGEHPCLAAGYYTLEVQGRLRFFLEYVPGKPLPLSVATLPRALDLATQLSCALELLHARGVAHGGLVPGRCLVLADETLRLTPDLGNPLSPEGRERYLAPEHRRGRGASPQGDVYALGGILDGLLANVDKEPWAELMSACRADKAADRPSAKDVSQALGEVGMRVAKWRSVRPVASHERTELGENRRAAAYHTMGDGDQAKAILDAWLGGRKGAPLTFVNRKILAVNAGEVDAAALPEPLGEQGGEAEPVVQAFRERLGAHVLVAGGPVRAVAFSPDGALVLTGSEKLDETARLWQTATGKLVQVMKWSRDRTLSVGFHPDGTHVATGSDWGAVRLWNATSGQLVRTMNENWGRVTQVAFSPDGKLMLVGGRDGSARLWDTSRGEQVLSWKAHAAIVTSVAFSPDGQFVLTGGADARVRSWETLSGKPGPALDDHRTRVNAVAFSPDGKFVLTGSSDSIVRLWVFSSGKAVMVLKGHSGEVTAVGYTPKGDVLLSGSSDGTARLWNAQNGEPFRTLVGHTAAVTSVAASPSGGLVVTGSEDATARVWGVKGPRRPKPAWSLYVRERSGKPPAGEEAPEALLQRLRAGDLSAYAPLTAALRRAPPPAKLAEWVLLREATCRSLGTRVGMHTAVPLWDRKSASAILALAVETSGAHLVVATRREVEVRDRETGRLLRGCHFDMPARLAALDADGRYALTCEVEDRWDLWGIREEKRLGLGHTDSPIRALALSADGKVALTGHDDGVARVWDTKSHVVVCELAGHTHTVTSVAFDASGKLWLTGSADHTARLWDAQKQLLLHTLEGHSGAVRALALSRDGQLMATGGDDRSVRLWEPAGEVLLAVLPHKHEVTSLALDPGARFVLVASEERAVHLWDRVSGHSLSLSAQGSAKSVVALAADGVVFGAGLDGFIEAWAPDSDWVLMDDLLSQVEALLGSGAASSIWPQATDAGNVDAWLDVWRDLCQAREGHALSEEQARRLGSAQHALGDVLGRLMRKRPILLERITKTDPILKEHLARGKPAEMAPAAGARESPKEPRRPSAQRPAARSWRHLSLSMLGLGPGVALLAVVGGPVGLAVGALAIAGGLWQGVEFAKTLKKGR